MRELKDKIPAPVNAMNFTWKPPQEPFVKVNFDAAFKTILHHSYSGFVIRNSRVKERMSIPEYRFWVEDLPAAAKVHLARDLSGLVSQI
ncbi:hypothetical protein GOBAR_AA30907 [Gossypium barbadense]|uniref:Uncharacterized protein n=1 Tax=Gossypium barbadense TaxID=3634 RepID=A0A2P5WFD7_GOSBA|nr:hypothetical protein GOBAR_AA30907 [Gossypium barbadense]